VIPGLYQDRSVEAMAWAINSTLRNIGKTVFFCGMTVNSLSSDQIGDFKSLVADLNAGKVDWLIVLNANPVYDAPTDLEFTSAMQKAKTVVHLGLHEDETESLAHWHIPAANYLEFWSDARAYDGTVSMCSPDRSACTEERRRISFYRVTRRTGG